MRRNPALPRVPRPPAGGPAPGTAPSLSPETGDSLPPCTALGEAAKGRILLGPPGGLIPPPVLPRVHCKVQSPSEESQLERKRERPVPGDPGGDGGSEPLQPSLRTGKGHRDQMSP